jgi:hypothetical protein
VRYRVAFAKRFRSDGQESSIDPTVELDTYLSDGVVAEKTFVERLEPAAQHNQEVLDEDDAFLGAAVPEVWEYEVVDVRRDEFESALRKADGVLESEIIDESETPAGDATAVPLSEGGSGEPGDYGAGATPGGGPAGASTVDRSAGGMGPARPHGATGEVEGIEEPGAGGIDELRVATADDPRLGLTDSENPDADWAADTGPANTPERGIETRDLTDKSSTLRRPPTKSGEADKRRRRG